MPVLKVDCQLLTRALSGRSYCRPEESLLHFGGKCAPNCGHRFAESCYKFVCRHSITCWLKSVASRRRLPPRTGQSDSAPARPRREQAIHIYRIVPDRLARDKVLKRRNDAVREALGINPMPSRNPVAGADRRQCSRAAEPPGRDRPARSRKGGLVGRLLLFTWSIRLDIEAGAWRPIAMPRSAATRVTFVDSRLGRHAPARTCLARRRRRAGAHLRLPGRQA